MDLIELPSGWNNFRIVETVSGSFTGQVTIDDPKLAENFTEAQRRILADYTRVYLEAKISYKITKHSSIITSEKGRVE